MTLPKTRRTYWTALPLFAVAIAVLALTWGSSAGQETEAATEGAKTQMELVVRGTSPAQGPVTCTENGPKCTLVLGSTFTLSVVPSIIPIGGYSEWAALVDYGNLTYKPAADEAGEITWDKSFLPARAPSEPTGKEGQIAHIDRSGFLPPFPVSFQKSAIVRLTMNCAGNNKPPGQSFSTIISMINIDATPAGSVYLEGDALTPHVPNVGSIDVNCVPKPQPTGSLSGISDVLVHMNDKNLQAFYCKTRTDHDAVTNEVKTASTCFSDTPGQAAPGDKVPTDPNIDLNGPPPPPPYGEAGPQKGEGAYDPGTDTLVTTTCFESLGGTLGPNVIWVVTIPNAKATLPNQSGIVDIYFGQGIDACKALAPAGDPTQTLPLNIDTYDEPPYAKVTSVDSDGDGCADAFELDKTRPNKDCGDDPWNPHDSDLNFSGIFTITIEVIRADTCPGTAGPPPIGCDGAAAGDIVAGSYFNCQAALEQTGNDIAGKAFCYVDNPVTAVNVEDNGGALTCAPFPSANPEDCGDGLPGAPPPGPFADNNGVTTPGVITGVLDKATNKLLLDVCFQDIDQPLIGPGMYAQIQVDAHTMLGTASIWLNQTDCVKPDKSIDPPDNLDVAIALGEQDADYDVDQDGCTTAEELDAYVFGGGQRDPYNKNDHMDINKDGFINVPDDIIGTFIRFGPSVKSEQGNVGPRMTGSVPWAHSNGDAVIGIPDDILGTAAQFGHNCDGTPG